MKIAIYARVSTEDKGQDPLNQLLQHRRFAGKQGWTITQEYTEEVSGSKSDRAAFQQMWKDAGRRRFNLLLFWSLDRFTSEGTLRTLVYLQRLSAVGIDYRSYTEPFIDSLGPFRDAIIGLRKPINKL
jgi:DNA invertase Pin-like site-specific DNA recombinase